MAKKTTPVATAGKLAASVALPASTGDGVVHEIDAADLARTGEHLNDDIAGDLAAAEVTRPVVAVGAVVEPVNPALASEPVITGDAAGDAAIEAAGAGAEFVQPLAVDISTLRSDTFSQSAFLADPALENSTDNPARSTTSVEVGAGDPASPAADDQTLALAMALTDCDTFEELVDMACQGQSFMNAFDFVTMSGGLMAGWTPAEDASEIVLHMADLLDQRAEQYAENRIGLDEALGGAYSRIRITAKVAGFRRGGRAHPAEPNDYRLDLFTPDQVKAILDEPQLVVELF